MGLGTQLAALGMLAALPPSTLLTRLGGFARV
jgi:hypothetical protein